MIVKAFSRVMSLLVLAFLSLVVKFLALMVVSLVMVLVVLLVAVGGSTRGGCCVGWR